MGNKRRLFLGSLLKPINQRQAARKYVQRQAVFVGHKISLLKHPGFTYGVPPAIVVRKLIDYLVLLAGNQGLHSWHTCLSGLGGEGALDAAVGHQPHQRHTYVNGAR